MNGALKLRSFAFRSHWFYFVAAIVLIGDVGAIALDSWASPRWLEAGLLFDFVVLIPLLYLWCYRARGRAAVLRALALSCLGIWAAGHVVPPQHHQLLNALVYLRYAGIAVMLALEIKLVVTLYRSLGKRQQSSEDVSAKLADELDLPPWLVRLAAWEVAFWRSVWKHVKRLTGRK